eukprot:m.66115 g.66115  ORF g.66115 m.66115 type:complete len:1073 (+) comp11783_c0_seq2:306-3524(+)
MSEDIGDNDDEKDKSFKEELARRHRRKVLLRIGFDALQENWEDQRREWRPRIRARVFHEYCVLRSYFGIWQRAKLASDEIHEKESLGDAHYHRFLLRRNLQAWKQYCVMRKEKQEIKHLSALYFNKIALRHAWTTWKEVASSKRFALASEKALATQRQAILLKNTWERWLKTYYRRINQRELLQRAISTRELNCKLRAFRVWQEYVIDRRRKVRLMARALQFYNNHNCQAVWDTWRTKLKQKQTLLALSPLAASLAQRICKRRAFQNWESFVRLSKEYKKMKEIAAAKADKSRLRNTLTAWVHAYIVSCQRREQAELAATMERKRFLRAGMIVWKKKFEDRQEVLLKGKTEIALLHYTHRLTAWTFRTWWTWTLQRNAVRVQAQIADQQLNGTVLRRAWDAWESFVKLQTRKRWLNSKADSFRRKAQVYKYFTIWETKYNQVCRHNRLENLADVFHNTRLLAVAFTLWKMNFHELLRLQGTYNECVSVHNHHLTKDMFRKWQRYTTRRKEKQGLHYQAIAYNDHLYVRHYWNHWMAMTSRSRSFERATEFRNAKLTKLVMSKWKEFLILQTCRRDLKTQAEDYWKRIVTKHAWHNWKLRAIQIQGATRYYEHRILKRYFVYLQQHRRKQQDAMFLLTEKKEEFLNTKTKNMLRSTFVKWKHNTKLRQVEWSKVTKANLHYRRRTLGTLFETWQQYTSSQIKKSHLRIRSNRWRQYSLLSSSFTTWKRISLYRHVQREKEAVAILFHNLSVQNRFLQAWKLFANERIERNRMRDKLLEARQAWITKIAVKRWLHWSGNRSKEKMEAIVNLETCAVVQLQQRVRKFAMRWLRITKERHRNRNVTPSRSTYTKLSTPTKESSIPNEISHDTTELPIRQIPSTLRMSFTGMNRAPPRRPAFLALDAVEDVVSHFKSSNPELHEYSPTRYEESESNTTPDDTPCEQAIEPQDLPQGPDIQLHPVSKQPNFGQERLPIRYHIAAPDSDLAHPHVAQQHINDQNTNNMPESKHTSSLESIRATLISYAAIKAERDRQYNDSEGHNEDDVLCALESRLQAMLPSVKAAKTLLQALLEENT